MTNMTKIEPEVSEDDITKLFREVDLDKDGYISPKEAKRAYKRLSKLLGKENDKVSVITFTQNHKIMNILLGDCG